MERWSGPFPTENLAGVFSAALAVAAVVAAMATRTLRQPWARWATVIVAASLALIGLVGIAASGSRAAALGLVVALAALAWRRAIGWRAMLVVLAGLAVVSLRLPTGARVVESLGGDTSISDRLRLWWASCALVGDHPWRGVPSAFPISWVEAWYLPRAYDDRFASPLNVVLDSALSHGLPVTALFVALVAWPLVLAADPALRGRRLPLGGAAVALVLVVGAVFQAHQRWWPYALTAFLALVFTAGAALAVPLARRARVRWAGGLALGIGLATVGAVAVVAVLALRAHPWRVTREGGDVVVTPRALAPTAILVLAADSQQELVRDGHAWARAALAEGVAVRLVERGAASLGAAVADAGAACPLAAVGLGDAGTRWWSGASPLGAGVLGVAIDPLAIPSQSADGRWLVIAAQGAPFIPLRDLRRRALPGERIVLLAGGRVDPVDGWRLVAEELRRADAGR